MPQSVYQETMLVSFQTASHIPPTKSFVDMQRMALRIEGADDFAFNALPLDEMLCLKRPPSLL